VKERAHSRIKASLRSECERCRASCRWQILPIFSREK